MTISEITEFLTKNGIKPSYQRIKIFECLIECDNHPTAESIFRELVKTIPTLSKTTIYNSMKTFVDKGLVKIVTIDGNEVHYDPILEEHGHFQCRICGELYNVPISNQIDYSDSDIVHSVEERNVYLKGICKNCV